NSLEQPFSKEIEGLNLNLYLSLPDKIRFNLNGKVSADPTTKLKAQGAYSIADKEFQAKVYLQDLKPQDFLAYYRNAAVTVSGGRIDSSIELKYNLKDKKLIYSGKATAINLSLKGINFVGEINEINAEAAFDNSGILAQNFNARVLGLPVRASFNLADFTNPLINAQVVSDLSLAVLQGILKEKFKFYLPAEIQGDARLYLALQGALRSTETPRFSGYLDISQATLKPEKSENPFQNVNGRIEFSEKGVSWPALDFEYQGIAYRGSGTLADFKAPQVKFSLSSKELSLESAFAVSNKAIKLSRFSGRYFHSQISLSGEIDIAKPPDFYAGLEGSIDIDLRDSGEFLRKFKGEIEKINPGGVVHAKLGLNGNLNDFKSCAVSAQFNSDSISLYGLKSQEFFLAYNQLNGLAGITAMRLSLYSGILKANAQMRLSSEDNFPYRINAVLENLRIEKLKADTPFKDKDIAGTLSAQAALSGELKDISKLNGSGEIFITDGKLWQLNLFKGLGGLIFVKDFANIIFQEGHCGFVVGDKQIFTDNLKLSSNIAELNGSLKLGFDNSINALLNVRILDEQIPLTGTFRDIATAIVGQGGKFGTIEIRGTLVKPEYKFKVSVVDIIKGIKDTFFRKQN
ncbi:MAG: DUF748 domain-containing protein, partial [Candidatus Omnitrophota bacterium]|nr:DUF748 domain-containing protein [Candidatus Omnitrophota bacterium]